MFTPVYGVRERRLPGGQTHMDYWVADGVYGTFNCLLYDYQRPQPLVLPADEVAGVAAPADMASAHSQVRRLCQPNTSMKDAVRLCVCFDLAAQTDLAAGTVPSQAE